MNTNCEIIRDLIPLYIDDVCSGAAREVVEEHAANCEDCSALIERMRNNELEIAMSNEKNEVLSQKSEFFRKKSTIAGLIIAGMLLTPVLICFIVDLATGGGLTWFFIVLASILVAASVTVVPLIVPENKALWTFVSTVGSLVLLLAISAIYTSGKWFFVAAFSVLFGLGVIFLPFVAKAKPVAKYLGNNKGVAVLGADTLLYILMMTAIGLTNRSPGFFASAGAYSMPFLLLIWAFFAIIRYLKCGGLIKGGICTALTGAFILTIDWIMGRIGGYGTPFPKFNPSVWNYTTSDGNVKWIIMFITGFIGLMLILAGILVNRNKAVKER